MIDRNDLENIFNIVKEDFNWLKEDIVQNKSIFKEIMIESINNDLMDGFDDFKEKYQDLNKILQKIDDLRNEYISIIKGEEEHELIVDGMAFDYLNDWTGTSPAKVLLFNKLFHVKYWQDILLILLEEIYKIDERYISRITNDDYIKERSRIPYTFEKAKIRLQLYKETSFGLYVLVNDNANTIYSRCIKLLKYLGYTEDDLKIKLSSSYNSDRDIQEDKEVSDITDVNTNDYIKLPRKYGSISTNKPLFKTLVSSIVNRKTEFGTDYIEPRRITERYESLILNNTKYTVAYHVVINIINYFRDMNIIDNLVGTKRGKYIIVDDDSLKSWILKNLSA